MRIVSSISASPILPGARRARIGARRKGFTNMRRGLADLDWIMNYEILSCMRYRRFASIIMLSTENSDCDLDSMLEETIRNSDELFIMPMGYAVLMGETEKAGALRAVERYKENVKEVCDLRFGIATYPMDGKSAAELLSAARRRLDRARSMASGCVVTAD